MRRTGEYYYKWLLLPSGAEYTFLPPEGELLPGKQNCPVNNVLDNLLVANANEAYSMVLAGFGYALIPGHLLMPHPDLSFYRWKGSPTCPFGIYFRKDAVRDSAVISSFLKTAEEVFCVRA